MATTVNVLCYKSKTLSNGEHPLMIRICKDGKKETEIVKLKTKDKLFTTSTLKEQISNSVKPKTIEEEFKEYIQLLQDENKRGYMFSVKQVDDSLIKYNKHLDIHSIEVSLIHHSKTTFFH